MLLIYMGIRSVFSSLLCLCLFGPCCVGLHFQLPVASSQLKHFWMYICQLTNYIHFTRSEVNSRLKTYFGHVIVPRQGKKESLKLIMQRISRSSLSSYTSVFRPHMLQHSMVRLHSFTTLLRNGMLIQISLIMMEGALYTGLYLCYMFLICLLVISACALCNIPPC